jgi:nucleotidyltransferase/DNA polymerase involved in DNA repair
MSPSLTQAYDLTDATWEIVLMLTVSFTLGWLFRYFWSMRGIDLAALVAEQKQHAVPNKFAQYSTDNLQIVEGVGPKIEELLKTHGVTSWKALSETSVDRLKEILLIGGERFQMHDPSSWPDQVSLALENRWNELDEYQQLLSGGRAR